MHNDTVPQLIIPVTRVQASFTEAMAEFHAEGQGWPDDKSTEGHYLRAYRFNPSPPAFAAYVEAVRADARPDAPRPEGHVPVTTLWYVENSTYLGRLIIRHALTPHLLEWGGHIGYNVRPSARRQGHATAILRSALPHAHRLGIEPVLLTCDSGNIASRKVIEHCGGVLEDERRGKLRFWIATADT